MAKSQFAAMMSMVVAVAACCLFSVPEACGQFQRNDQQRNRGGQNTGVFSSGQQGAVIGQQGGAFNSRQQGPTRGPQFGPGQQPGTGTSNTRQGGFVGSDAQDMRRSFENMSDWQRRRVRFDMVVESLNEMRESRRQRNRRRRRPDPIRVQLRPSFDYPQLESRQVAVTLQSNLTRALDLQGLVAPRVELDGRTATVSGSVPNERERAVIERMLALQPGVSIVKNLLTIDPVVAPTDPFSAESAVE